MRHKRLKLCVVFLFMLGATGLLAQETIPATGGNASGSGGSASYTIGQVTYTTIIGTNGTVAQGIQQPYEISTVTGIEKTLISLTIVAYPNPTTDFLQLLIESEELNDFSYQLFDIHGKLLNKEKIKGKQTSIIMEYLVPSTYFVKVLQENKEVKTFKIIKTH